MGRVREGAGGFMGGQKEGGDCFGESKKRIKERRTKTASNKWQISKDGYNTRSFCAKR